MYPSTYHINLLYVIILVFAPSHLGNALVQMDLEESIIMDDLCDVFYVCRSTSRLDITLAK